MYKYVFSVYEYMYALCVYTVCMCVYIFVCEREQAMFMYVSTCTLTCSTGAFRCIAV